jgi:hypothetical protein
MNLTEQIRKVIALASENNYSDAADWIQAHYFNQMSKTDPPSPTGNRAAKMGELVTPLTLYAIRNVAKHKGVDVEMECTLMYECLVGEITETIAQHFLEHLRAIDASSYMEGRTA